MDKLDKAIGLLGGSFDPIHSAHLNIALIAQQRFKLDRVDFIVANISPNKEAHLDAERRLALVDTVIQDYPGLVSSRIEIDRGSISYSHQTVADYKTRYPEAELYWILGYDTWLDLPTWQNFEYLQANLTFIVLSRGDVNQDPSAEEALNKISNSYFISDVDFRESSTQLREIFNNYSKEEILAQHKLKGLLPDSIQDKVLEYYASRSYA